MLVQLPYQEFPPEIMTAMSSQTAIVLVHGAYHTSWHLQTLKGELEKYGHCVVTPDLPSAGHHATLQQDTDTIKDAIIELAKNYERILPVFHSYAGIPGSEALAELPDAVRFKVVNVVYLAALVLPQGTSLTGPTRDRLSPWVITRHGFCAVPSARSTFFGDASPELQDESFKRVVVHSQIPFDTLTKHAGWTQYPGTYVVFTEDRALPEKATNAIWNRIEHTDKKGFWRLEKMEGSHCPFVTRASQLAEFIHAEAESRLSL